MITAHSVQVGGDDVGSCMKKQKESCWSRGMIVDNFDV